MNEVKFNPCPLCGRVVDEFAFSPVSRKVFNSLLPDTCISVCCRSCRLVIHVFTQDNPEYSDFDTCVEVLAKKWNRLSAISDL